MCCTCTCSAWGIRSYVRSSHKQCNTSSLATTSTFLRGITIVLPSLHLPAPCTQLQVVLSYYLQKMLCTLCFDCFYLCFSESWSMTWAQCWTTTYPNVFCLGDTDIYTIDVVWSEIQFAVSHASCEVIFYPL